MRFLKEYANFKIRRLKADREWCEKGTPRYDEYGRGIEKIEKIVRLANSGTILLDEAMEYIARV